MCRACYVNGNVNHKTGDDQHLARWWTWEPWWSCFWWTWLHMIDNELWHLWQRLAIWFLAYCNERPLSCLGLSTDPSNGFLMLELWSHNLEDSHRCVATLTHWTLMYLDLLLGTVICLASSGLAKEFILDKAAELGVAWRIASGGSVKFCLGKLFIQVVFYQASVSADSHTLPNISNCLTEKLDVHPHIHRWRIRRSS